MIDANSDANLIATIESLLEGHGQAWSDDRLEDLPRIDEFLSQRVGAVPHIGLLGRSAREFTTRLSGGLSTWVSRLSMRPWHLRVRGTAGSGKTQLALQNRDERAFLRKAACDEDFYVKVLRGKGNDFSQYWYFNFPLRKNETGGGWAGHFSFTLRIGVRDVYPCEIKIHDHLGVEALQAFVVRTRGY